MSVHHLLFVYFMLSSPRLFSGITHKHLGTFPTPIKKFTDFSPHFSLYIKYDGHSGLLENGQRLFGGNKVRKLEYLLADAWKKGAQKIVTLGCAGSNHALATSIYAKRLRFHPICLMLDQEKQWQVQRNLLLHGHNGTELHMYNTEQDRNEALEKLMADDSAYFIPTGGSNEIGVIGFVQAALELKAQIEQGLLPTPDYIFIPTGSCGSIAGLLLGLQIAKLPTKVIGVVIEPPPSPNYFEETIESLFNKTNIYLHTHENAPLLSFDLANYALLKKFSGPEYGIKTGAAQAAIDQFATLGTLLDGVYTGKAAAGMLEYFQKSGEALKGKTILFWHTFCDEPFTEIIGQQDYKKLPKGFHHYFE